MMSGKYRSLFFALIALTALLAACAQAPQPDTSPPLPWETSASAAAAQAAPLVAGLGVADVSPHEALPLGGYGVYFGTMRTTRLSEGIHDPLYATALYLEKGPDRLLIVAVDSLGLIKGDIDRIRDMAEDELRIDRARVIVTASHTHHAPDTVGLWGTIFPPRTGRSETYMNFVARQIVSAGRRAIEAKRPATLLAAVGEEKALHENIRSETDPNAPIDHTLTVLVLRDAQGAVFGTVTNWGCHPTTEGGDNRLVSADWVHYLRTTLAESFPSAHHMFINGSIGGAIQPSEKWRDQNSAPDVPPFTWTRKLGNALGTKVVGMIPTAKPVEVDRIEVRHAPVRAFMHNDAFALGRSLKLLAMDLPPKGGQYLSEVTAVKMGALRLGTMPGEILPDIGNQVRTSLGGDTQVLIGLGQDWMGYVMTPDKYDDPRYAYEKMLCIGPQFGANVIRAYEALRFE